MTLQLNIFDHIPSGFLECSPKDLHKVLPGPSLINLTGRKEQRLFVSILQHGNEEVGLIAVQELLKKYQDRELPKSLSIFVGNVEAARHGVRRLDSQPDYNRVWPTTPLSDCPEKGIMHQVTDLMKKEPLFASVDLHNNIGLNPHYACINKITPAFLHLANLFSRTVVYFTSPKGVQSLAFSELCPSTTLECGPAGSMHGAGHAIEFLDACLHLNELEHHTLIPDDINLFHTVALVKVPGHLTLGVDDDQADISLFHDIEKYNFTELQAGTALARIKPDSKHLFDVYDENGNEVREKFLKIEHNEIRINCSVMPSMLTINQAAIRQDCLCYFMERYPLPNN